MKAVKQANRKVMDLQEAGWKSTIGEVRIRESWDGGSEEIGERDE